MRTSCPYLRGDCHAERVLQPTAPLPTRAARCAVLSIAAVLALSGCASAADAGALVALDDSSGTVCTPADAEGRAAFGISYVENQSGEPVEVIEVELVGAEGMELLGFELRSPDGQDANAVGMDYDEFGPPSIALPQQVAAGESRVALVGVAVSADAGGEADALRITFRSSTGVQGTAETSIAMQVAPEGTACDMG